jgi:hypothetical protein
LEIVGNFPGIDLFDATVEENRIVLTPVKIVPVAASLNAVRAKLKKLGLGPKDVVEAVQWARK